MAVKCRAPDREINCFIPFYSDFEGKFPKIVSVAFVLFLRKIYLGSNALFHNDSPRTKPPRNLIVAEEVARSEKERSDRQEDAQNLLYVRLTAVLGVLTAIIGTTGLIGEHTAIVPFGSLFFSYFSIAFSTALIWIFFGAVLVYLSIWPKPARGRYIIMAGISLIAIIEALEIPLNILGIRVFGRTGILPGTSAIEYPATSYFPVGPVLIIAAAVALILLVKAGGESAHQKRTRDALGITGSFIAIVSFMFIIGYLYGVPFLYGTPFIPIGVASALAGFCTGSGFVAAAGPSAIPLRYFSGTSVRSRLLRTIIPLIFVFFLLDNILDVFISSYFNIHGTLLFSLTAVSFSLVASLAVGHLSKGLSMKLEAEEKRRKQTEEALREANKKLNLLNSITRHDILNQLMVIDGYLEIFQEECHGDEKLRTYFERVIQSTKMIEHQISFTKFYQELGVHAPVWHRVQSVAEWVSGMAGFEKIRFTINTESLEVFADPLFEKVFFNLFDNAVRHGEHVSEIHVRFERRGTEGVIVVEDNGVGVSVADKPKIFLRGYGKHTGFGLFLTKEILTITGVRIQETGKQGQGARFEMIVPSGGFRVLAAT